MNNSEYSVLGGFLGPENPEFSDFSKNKKTKKKMIFFFFFFFFF